MSIIDTAYTLSAQNLAESENRALRDELSRQVAALLDRMEVSDQAQKDLADLQAQQFDAVNVGLNSISSSMQAIRDTAEKAKTAQDEARERGESREQEALDLIRGIMAALGQEADDTQEASAGGPVGRPGLSAPRVTVRVWNTGDAKLVVGDDTSEPKGWLNADGGEVSQRSYQRLFLRFGHTFGTPSRADVFKLPNLTAAAVATFGANVRVLIRT